MEETFCLSLVLAASARTYEDMETEWTIDERLFLSNEVGRA